MSAIAVLGIILFIAGIIIIVGYFGYLLKINIKENNLSKIVIILNEWIGFTPFTIGLLISAVGLLLIIKYLK